MALPAAMSIIAAVSGVSPLSGNGRLRSTQCNRMCSTSRAGTMSGSSSSLLSNHIVAGQAIEHVAGFGDLRRALPRIHQVQFLDFKARIAQRQRVGIALEIERAHRIQQEIGNALIVIRPAQNAMQRRVASPARGRRCSSAPMRPRTHRHGLRVGRHAGLDHGRLARDADRDHSRAANNSCSAPSYAAASRR